MLLNKKIKTLIIDDHALITKAYKDILDTLDSFALAITIAHNCDDAIEQINALLPELVLLDLQLPASKDEKFISGEDIGLWLRVKYPNTKILILTAISDSERIRSIIKMINPEGFIIKSDMDPIDLITAVQSIMINGTTYYSNQIKDFKYNNINGYTIDDLDRKLLYHLSMGEKTKDLPKLLHISLRAIEDRKVKLRDIFGITKNSDTNLIKEAKQRNII